MKIKNGTLAFALIASVCPAFAATDGALDMVGSVGTYTNTFGATVPNGRKIQVSGLLDAAIDSKTPLLSYGTDAAQVGVRDKFCVTDNAGGNVRIKLTTTNPSGRFFAYTPAGENLEYYVMIGLGSAAPVTYGAGSNADVIAAPVDKTACGTGNVSKSVHTLPTSILFNKTYIDTVIVTATPL